MPDPDEVERKIREMLIDMGDCRLLEEFEGAVKAYNERCCRIDETLEDLLQEVDDLLLRMDELEAAKLESDDDEI